MLFGSSLCQSQALSTSSESLAQMLKQDTLVNVVGSLKHKEGVDIAAFDRSLNMDHAPRYVTYLRLDRLHLLVWNCNLYLEVKKRAELLQYVPVHGQFPQRFQNWADFMETKLKITRSSSPRWGVIKLEEDIIPVK